MPHLRGEDHPRSKLTEQDVIELLHDYEPGLVSERALAEQLGVSRSYVHRILKGQAWAHIPRGQPRGS